MFYCWPFVRLIYEFDVDVLRSFVCGGGAGDGTGSCTCLAATEPHTQPFPHSFNSRKTFHCLSEQRFVCSTGVRIVGSRQLEQKARDLNDQSLINGGVFVMSHFLNLYQYFKIHLLSVIIFRPRRHVSLNKPTLFYTDMSGAQTHVSTDLFMFLVKEAPLVALVMG